MNKKKLIVVICWLISMVNTTIGNDAVFRTKQIEQTVSNLGIHDIIPTIPKGTSTIKYKNKYIRIHKNSNNEIDHIGIPLFSRQQRHLQPSSIYDYLEFSYLDKTFNITKQPSEYRKIRFLKGSWTDMKMITDSTSVTITKVDNRFFIVRWETTSNKTVELSAPIQYDILSNSNRLEMENNFIKDLERVKRQFKYVEKTLSLNEIEKESLMFSGGDTIYIAKGDTLFTDYVSDDLYYIKEGKDFALLHSDKYPVFSVFNMFLTGKYAEKKTVNIDFRKGDFTSSTVRISLDKLLSTLKKQRTHNFVSLKKKDKDYVTISLYAYDADLGSLHLFIMNSRTESLLSGLSPIEAKCFLYIPISNIRNIFADK